MLNLRDYFLENIGELSPYKKFILEIKEGYDDFFLGKVIPEILLPITTTTEEDLIKEFRTMIQPSNSYSFSESYKFILICFYLDRQGYYIKQFPSQLSNPSSLNDFAVGEIRGNLLARGIHENKKVTWDSRRVLIGELEFMKENSIKTNFTDDMEDSFKKISTRNSAFDEMSNAEKLKEISNLIEYKLKVNGNFMQLEEHRMAHLLTNQNLIDYRKATQCYRHSSEEYLKLREAHSANELFLIYYGISFLHAIFDK